jgi:hypothetical protein
LLILIRALLAPWTRKKSLVHKIPFVSRTTQEPCRVGSEGGDEPVDGGADGGHEEPDDGGEDEEREKADGWSLKRLHRRILLSATWQMSSRYDAEKFAKDGENRWLWRMHPRKLEGEAWRDSLLAVTGELDGTVGGVPEDDVLASRRRTLYGRISRTGDVFATDAFLRLFDFPAAVATAEQRVTSTVPQQYLFMLNSPFMTARAAALGEWMSKRPGGVAEKVGEAYWRLYGREVSAAERALAGEWLGDEPAAAQWAGYAQVLLSAHELMQIP